MWRFFFALSKNRQSFGDSFCSMKVDKTPLHTSKHYKWLCYFLWIFGDSILFKKKSIQKRHMLNNFKFCSMLLILLQFIHNLCSDVMINMESTLQIVATKKFFSYVSNSQCNILMDNSTRVFFFVSSHSHNCNTLNYLISIFSMITFLETV